MSGTPTAPDVLVLGAGGVLGEAWTNGVLAGLEDAAGVDLRHAEAFVGTSAGSIVAARLAAGHRPRRPGAAHAAEAMDERAGADDDGVAAGDAGEDEGGRRPTLPGAGAAGALGARAARGAGRLAWTVTAPLTPVAVALGAPAGRLARSAVLARIPAGSRGLRQLHGAIARSGVRFDGRLRICCVDRRSGRRVVFGSPGAPVASVADAVVASCAIPGVFAPVRIGGREYVDGGAWSVTNADAAPARERSEVLLLEPTALPARSWHTPEGALRAALGASTAVELQVLRARGASVRRVTPDAASAGLMAGGLMRPEPAGDVLAAAYRQGLALAGDAGGDVPA
jgi:NTE family protein